MSDIIINLENLSRFNKRLQKALKKQFNQEVPLHIASNLFANSLGVNDEYQLKQKLETNINTQDNSINQLDNKDIYTVKAENLLKDIKNYFAENKSLLSSFVVYYIDRNVSLHIESKSKKFPTINEGFGLYFEDNPLEYLHDNLKKLTYSKEDLVFLENLCKNYFTDDYDQNIYVGSRLIKLIGLKKNQRPGQVDTVFLYEKENN